VRNGASDVGKRVLVRCGALRVRVKTIQGSKVAGCGELLKIY